ncbi:hypothetical protein HW090_03320 [Pseudomonas sp. ABC1]|uniref:DnaB-like helicase N-terminal domain-containing protein n=1 Tax=Pseudomonas sp. ABC1 TaxID=2748080 RepID=UPI0015C2DB96|nr:DnaB-like helicase N-terminal domain-containing protein [Pseudomonas sp. ABC1]QLF92283.1 hypothetical protein HW090_03320 [Pseudomonas sp. ABC1]
MSERRELYSLEAEHGVLGAVMLASLRKDDGLVEQILGEVDSGDFFIEDNAALFLAIEDSSSEGMPVDPVTVGITRRLLPSGESTLAYAGEISKNVPSAANWKVYAKHLHGLAVLRQVVAAASTVHELAHENRPVPEIVAQAQ